MADRVKNWCEHHAGLLANLFAVLAMVLLGVVCVQAWSPAAPVGSASTYSLP
jgi:hypothetical protein